MFKLVLECNVNDKNFACLSCCHTPKLAIATMVQPEVTHCSSYKVVSAFLVLVES